ncbi:MAG: helix-turn-helix domain-containing protein [Candidatus Aminicenantes bacterium]|nr:helix-turn-helix domain-containing protein [Candidatus Aminicenantes bacterium]NIM82662.1 helix-turn-helix domain-containing protein [Candidatus Aminicenantes bacterium]NIN22032.1 helix-turn-helix domain-containing protein [Candidatus Aminicenantes bacterium]NIN45792.1 helix-turn-helix domain-containing protein [Candidatus Aminicenantes bacterium]NIN88630.1 helix-turn-helix domain-containing protein [Candidatus Aminicenantes bacterium]
MTAKDAQKFAVNPEETGSRLRLFRKSRKITIHDLADRIGISKSTISEVERGHTKPPVNFLLAMFNLYGLNVNWVLTGEGKMILKKDAASLSSRKAASTGVMDDEYNQLLYYLENAPVVKYAVLGFFREYFHKNKDIIEENIHITKKRTASAP